jgi:hypothetical protein
MPMKKKNINNALIPECLHILLCGTILVISILSAYLLFCGKDGYVSLQEIERITEYFFICITEIVFFALAFDLIYKYENKTNE